MFCVGLDVFEDEPYMKPGLADQKNAIVVPHIASASKRTREGMATLAALNVLKDLRGIIKDCGYLCDCPSCNFSKVLNAFEFGKHAGCFTKHPNNHIFLENGKTIYGLVQEVKSSPFNMLEEVIRTLLGGPISEKHLQVWKESFQASRYEIKEINGNDEASQHCPMQLQKENNSIVCSPKMASEESLAPDSSSPESDS